MTSLPILENRKEILESLHGGNRLVIRAPTGSGKSTQVPQMLLDSGEVPGRILVLQPRRLAARMLAARVAQERGVALGTQIGFETRFESQVSAATRICFITEGILPRMLLTNGTLGDVSAVLFDEFHERSLTTDVGLSLLVDLQRRSRPDLKLLVMSATIDIEPLRKFLGDAVVIESTGRMFPVDIRYSSAPRAVPVWDRAAEAAWTLIGDGADGDILVFMPGAYEIRRTVEAMQAAIRSESVCVFSLYGDLPSEKQQRVMEPAGRRKIIVATNIAETSLTIPGVRHVIDSGMARVNRHDPGRGFNTLFVEQISIDSADQRAGRAGREAPGICVRLWSVSDHAGRSRRTTPEVLRVDLAETLLQIAVLGYRDPQEFRWFERPDATALHAAQEILLLLGAFDSGGEPTALGQQMNSFPMHPRLARLLIEAGKRNAVRLATFTAALLSERTALAGKPEYPEEALRPEVPSDFYGLYCLIEKVSESGFDPAVCVRHAINASAARAILRTQALFLQICRHRGMHTRDGETAPEELAQCVLLAYPDHLAVRKDRGTLVCLLRDNRRGELARESIVRPAQMFVAADIREIKSPKLGIKTILSLAASIRPEWLHTYFPSQWREDSVAGWNASTMEIENRVRTSCLGVVLSDKSSSDIDRTRAAALLAETIIQKNLKILSWDLAVEEWINRVRWVAETFPEQNLPAFTDEHRDLVIHALCEGEYRYERVKSKPVLPLLMEFLTYQQRRFIDAMAPAMLPLPSGRKMRIDYSPGKKPSGRARIQDLYGLKNTPCIGAGRAGVVIEVLAPNNRPVQITDDLGRFWQVHYPELKKTLSRRYPRHEWR